MQRRVLAGIAVLAALALAAVVTVVPQVTAVSQPAQSQSRWADGYFPNLPVVTQDGKTLHFYDDLIKGKIVVIDFIYTNCPDLCPIGTARLAQLEDKLGDAMGRDYFFISMSVDPERDTPQRLKEYAQAFDAGPGWFFVTGKPDDIRAINYALGQRSSNLNEHRNGIVLGNAPERQWQRDSLFGDLDRVVNEIHRMNPKWRDEVRTLPTGPAGTGALLHMSNQPGEALFSKLCAPCHSIGAGDRVGPDLRGVTQRRDHAWLSSFIRNPARMRAQQDPVALQLAAKFPGVRMPLLGLTELDAVDLINYLEVRNARLEEKPEPASSSPGHDHHAGENRDQNIR